MCEQNAEILHCHVLKRRQGQDTGSQFGRRHLAVGSQDTQCLVKQQAVRKPPFARRLDKTLLQIELDECDALQKLPRNRLRQDRTRFGMLLADHEPHLLRVSAAAGPAHPLQERRNRERRVDLERAFQFADIDPELQRRCRTGRQRGLLVLHLLLRGLPVRDRQIPVMDQETVRLMIGLAVLAQRRRDFLALLTRIAENKTFSALGMFKNIADPAVRRERRFVRLLHVRKILRLICRLFRRLCVREQTGLRRRVLQDIFHLGRLRVRQIEMLHRQPPLHAFRVDFRDKRRTSCPCREQTTRFSRITDRSGESDPARIHSCRAGEPLDQAEGLSPSVAPQQ